MRKYTENKHLRWKTLRRQPKIENFQICSHLGLGKYMESRHSWPRRTLIKLTHCSRQDARKANSTDKGKQTLHKANYKESKNISCHTNNEFHISFLFIIFSVIVCTVLLKLFFNIVDKIVFIYLMELSSTHVILYVIFIVVDSFIADDIYHIISTGVWYPHVHFMFLASDRQSET